MAKSKTRKPKEIPVTLELWPQLMDYQQVEQMAETLSQEIRGLQARLKPLVQRMQGMSLKMGIPPHAKWRLVRGNGPAATICWDEEEARGITSSIPPSSDSPPPPGRRIKKLSDSTTPPSSKTRKGRIRKRGAAGKSTGTKSKKK